MPDKRSRWCPTKSVEFWGGYAAANVINIANNEGAQFEGVLRLLLNGGESDSICVPENRVVTRPDFSLRHFIYSICKLPEEAGPSFDLYLGQPSGPHLARTFLALALLLPKDNDADDESLVRYAESTIHMLYSARIPHSVYQLAIRRGIHSLEQAVLQLNKTSYNNKSDWIPVGDLIHGPRWRVTTVFPAQTYLDTLQHLSTDYVTENSHCQALRAWDTDTKIEDSGMSRGRMSKYRYIGMCKWRSDGILLPYGHPRDEFELPNP